MKKVLLVEALVLCVLQASVPPEEGCILGLKKTISVDSRSSESSNHSSPSWNTKESRVKIELLRKPGPFQLAQKESFENENEGDEGEGDEVCFNEPVPLKQLVDQNRRDKRDALIDALIEKNMANVLLAHQSEKKD